MVENIQHDYFIWEEKNLTEPKTKLENNGVNEEVVSTNEIKNDLTQKDWKDITEPKLRRKAYRKAYHETNKEKRKVWRKVNRDKLKIQKKINYNLNKDKIKIQQKNSYQRNKEKRKAYRDTNKEKLKSYRVANKEKRNVYVIKKKKTDIQYKLKSSLRTRLHQAINGNFKSGSAVKDLGCSIEELKLYLESKFQPGMTWDNWTLYGWHIDHIKPLASFDLTDRQQFLEACHYTNLQPLWATDNIIKSDKIVTTIQ